MKIFIIGAEGLCKKYGLVVDDMNNILLVKEIHDRYDFADSVLAIHPETDEQAMYIETFKQTHPELANKLLKFINT